MIIAIVQDKDSGCLLEQLIADNYRATKLTSSGGFLRAGNTTFLIGVEGEHVSKVVEIIRKSCHARKQLVTPVFSDGTLGSESFLPCPIEVTVGGATIFVIDAEEFHKV